MNKKESEKFVEVLKYGGVGVMPTDTIYGLVGSAISRKAVARIYKLRRRNPKKPMIVLIGSINDIKKFGAMAGTAERKILKSVWPGKVSVILPINDKRLATKLQYLHRGTGALAFRLPKPFWLRRLLKKTGPLVAPSANWEGRPPAKTAREAKKYFGPRADFYLDGGKATGKPSRLVKIENGKTEILRK